MGNSASDRRLPPVPCRPNVPGSCVLYARVSGCEILGFRGSEGDFHRPSELVEPLPFRPCIPASCILQSGGGRF